MRLSFFNREWFNAIQEKNAAQFWSQLFTVFTPWAFTYVASTVIEYVVQSTLTIRWRRWLTDHYVSRWLDGNTHAYRYRLGVCVALGREVAIGADARALSFSGE